MEKGKIEGKIEMIKNLLKDKVPFDTALKCSGLDKETYEKYANEQ